MDIKKLERLVAKYLVRFFYDIFKLLPISNRITFATYRTEKLEGNFKYIYDEVIRRNLNYEFAFLFQKYSPSVFGKIKYMLHMIKAAYYMATSAHFIIDDYYFPVYTIKQREGTNIVQVWHACGAFKKFGYDVIGKGYGASDDYVKDIPIHTNYNTVIVSSDEVIECYATAFNMGKSNIKAIGVPRTDIFYSNENKEFASRRVLNRFPKLIGKTIVLYAPTFRGKGQTTINFDMTLDLDYISKNLPEGMVFALKMHPFVKQRMEKIYDNIIDISDYEDVNEILITSDILITDYSSVIFEFSILERPIIMYASDKAEYMEERDFYYEYESFVPGPIATTTEEVVNIIKNGDWDLDKVKRFKNKFFKYSDGLSTKRFVEECICKKKSAGNS